MRKVLGIARYTFTEIFRNKLYYVLVLFALVICGATLLLGALGGEQRQRMMVDVGLVSIEMFALLVAVFASTTLILEEMESRTLYLILTRPVARYQFLLGRFLGLLLLLTAAFIIMAGGHLVLLAWQNIPIHRIYALSLAYSWGKIVLVTALGMTFSLFATSTVSAVAFTFFFWVMGHFSTEMRFLATKTTQPLLTAVFDAFYYIAPNFQLLNLRDLPTAGQVMLPAAVQAAGYTVAYGTVCLAAAILLFRRKEF